MDIPNTGAIFTLGKSHLAENTQSYFYIKNDPIKRLIAGPYQSAVICESGRLFVWGENHYGQLGIGGQHSSNTNNNNNNNNGDIIIKPTCVKSLKTLGLKIADISFGNEWSIILTLSNELFFTGRNIFASDSNVSSNFTEATVKEELCEIIRKPFRLEEFDDCLSNSEETENFINVLAGNEHFVLLTSFGRLIGWGSNQSHQLGRSKDDVILKPHEIVLDSAIQQYTCGPESTLVLTQNGNLYLTGRLNEFVFPDFTELQKNLSSNEQIIFMHISKASEIFIVTNTGSIYRSYESVRNKSLIFQRFYDYDSEENGPIWKLLKGTSFYAVLTKANKFYTTFSESGHHLKTFREISKFKNLRLLDMALGDRHILVHGIPRSSTLAATIGPGGEHRYMTQSMIMANTTGGILNRIRNGNNGKSMELDETQTDIKLNETEEERAKTNTPVHDEELIKEETTETHNEIKELPVNDATENLDSRLNENAKKSAESIESSEAALTNNESSSIDTGNTVVSNKSPNHSYKSQASSATSLRKEIEAATSSVKSLRPRTPFPESSAHSSPQSTLKKTPKRNFSYEAAMNNDFIEHTSPALMESLENIPEHVTKDSAALPGLTISTATPPTEDDEELRLEISETTDPLDHTVTVNEIRFINNGIDVTANVKKFKSDGSEDSLDDQDEEEVAESDKDIEDNKSQIRKQAENLIEELEDEIDKKVETVKATKDEAEDIVENKTKNFGDKVENTLIETKDSINQAAKDAGEGIDTKLNGAKESVESAAMKAVAGARGAVQSVSETTKKATKEAKHTIENMGNSMASASDDARHAVSQMGNSVVKASGEAKDAMGNALRKMTGDTKQAVGAVTTKISTELHDAKNSLSSMLHVKKNKVDVQRPIDEHELEEDPQSQGTSKESGGGKSNTTTQSNNTTTGVLEDDERTTASANSNHTSTAGNPFESTNPFESNDPFDPELDAMVERGKQALREELQAASVAAGNRTQQVVVDNVVEEKSKFSKFLDEIREKSKSLSCRNEKSIKIEEDQPPRYSVEDELALQPVNGQANGSKVCTIL